LPDPALRLHNTTLRDPEAMSRNHYFLCGVFCAGIAVSVVAMLAVRPAPIIGPSPASAPPDMGSAHSSAALGSASATRAADRPREAHPAYDSAAPAIAAAGVQHGARGNTGAVRGSDNPLVRNPPPHVTSAAFYERRLGLDNGEAEKMRQNSLQELVRSMRDSGLPESEIAALEERLSQAAGAPEPPPPDDPLATAPSAEEQADDLNLSMQGAQLPAEHIEGMMEGLRQMQTSREAAEDERGADPLPQPTPRDARDIGR
jgi:hypothetical protein